MPDILQERRRYNDLIEDTDIACVTDVRNIHTYQQTERGTTLLQLTENLYSDLDLLYLLTSNLNGIDTHKVTEELKRWLDVNKRLSSISEKDLAVVAREGADIAFRYHNALLDTNYISLPGR